MFILDTNALIYFIQGQPKATGFLLGGLRQGRKFMVSAITLVEFLSYPAISEPERLFFMNLIRQLDILSVDFAVAMEAVSLRRAYSLELADSIVAATALLSEAVLVSRDKDFSKVKEIKVLSI